ncbi:MAG: heavy metal sensor histidine kinase [Blastocatellia bacterium]|nr:heavy metal sensor histidine kinase [Blastocatellia bacterium]
MNPRSIRFRLTAWYAGLLALVLLLFGGSTWFGLAHYLNRSLTDSLARQAQQIGENFLLDVQTSGERYVVDEIVEHYAPEQNDHFVRVTRGDGSTLYVSGMPHSKGFDPAQVSTAPRQLLQAGTREEHLPNGGELLIYSLPFTARDGRSFVIESGAPYDSIENVLRGLLLTLGISLPLLIALAAAGGYWIMRRTLRPLDEITSGAERITSRNLGERLPVAHSGDEVERLAFALNRMIARLDESFQYIRRFTADASHELRTPLTALRGELEAIAQRPRLEDDLQDTLGSSLEETARLSRIVEGLLAISRYDAGEAQMEQVRFDLSEVTLSTVGQMRLLAEDRNITLQCETNGEVTITGDRARVKQVIVNLVDNAIKYTPEGGAVQVMVGAEIQHAVLQVKDNGTGIPTDALPHLFERFYRVDKARSRQMGGAGLGLAIVKSIVTAHGGQVTVTSTEGKGSQFRVALPLSDETLERKTG